MPAPYPPGPPGDPILGNARAFIRDNLGFLAQCSRQYDDLVYIKVPTRDVYLLNHPDLIQQVLVREHHKVRKGPALQRNTYVAFGNGLLTSEGEFHDRQRRLMQPAFHTSRVDNYATIMVDATNRLLDSWQDGEARDIHADMMAVTMNIVAQALFSADLWAMAGELGTAIGEGMEILGRRIAKPQFLRVPRWLPTRQNRLGQRILDLLNGTIYGIIEERRADPGDRGDLLSMLLAAQDADGTQMTDRQVRDEVMTLFLAGHETTGNALAWTLWLLATHPTIAERLAAEVDAVLCGRPPTVADLAKLRFTEQVFKEGLRLYPPAWATSRQTLEPMTLNGYDISPGSTLVISPYALHRNPRFFTNPDTFSPDRFAPQERDSIPRYAYFPFGAGPRGCIGAHFANMESLIILAMIHQRYRLSVPVGQGTPQKQALITLPPDRLWLSVNAR